MSGRLPEGGRGATRRRWQQEWGHGSYLGDRRVERSLWDRQAQGLEGLKNHTQHLKLDWDKNHQAAEEQFPPALAPDSRWATHPEPSQGHLLGVELSGYKSREQQPGHLR